MKILVLAILIHQGKVLIVRRAMPSIEVQNLSWAFPGGKVELGETLEQALFREVLEETGIQLNDAALIHARIIPSTNILALYYRSDLPSHESVTIILNERELLEYKWITGKVALEHFTSDVASPIRDFLLHLQPS